MSAFSMVMNIVFFFGQGMSNGRLRTHYYIEERGGRVRLTNAWLRIGLCGV